MLELFSAGLVSGWLKMAGLPTSIDPWESVSQANLPATFWHQADPSAEKMIAQYLKLLKSQGLDDSNQGVWLQSGTTLLGDHRSIVPMPAASLTKVATSLAALQTWDINHQFETTIATTGTIQNGVLHGDLIIQDGGDPLFVWEDAVAVGNALNRLGITRVAGDLVIAGKYMMNFETEPEQSSDLLKKAWNPKNDDEDSRAEWAALPSETRRPTIAISGKVRSAPPNSFPTQTVLMHHRSLPLIHLLKYLNVHSQNEMAQSLADQLGGTQVVMQKAAAASGISPNELQLVNGSGLGMNNRISAHAVCAMFAAIERQVHPLNLTIGDLFPVAGVDRGTLEYRETPDRAVVKTGTLNEVSALAGVVPTRDRGLVWFAVINRGSNISELRKQQDLFLQTLQKAWGTIETAPMIEPSTWTTPQRERLDAQTRNQDAPISQAIEANRS